MTTQELATRNPRELRERRERYVTPRVNIIEHPETVTLEIELPGVPKGSLDLEIKDNELTIIGRKKQSDDAAPLRVAERPRADFRRVFTLSRAIDREKVDAHMENGLLTVTLHKVESLRPKKIQVN